MNVSKYKALLAAVDMGSFSAAANSLGYTQSGMTHMMNSLEDEIGFPILQRGYFGVKLTPEGEKIIQRIRDLVACEEALYNEIKIVKSYGYADGNSRSLRGEKSARRAIYYFARG